MSSIPVPRLRRWLLLSGSAAVLAGLVYLLAIGVERVQESADRITCNLEVLEQAGTVEARAVLQQLAAGADQAG